MKKIWIGILIVLFYCFPFAYYSMKQDFDNRSMIGYFVMIVATALLAFLSKYFYNATPIIIGNILSMIISFYFNGKMADTVAWEGGYFKPFSSTQLLVVVSLLNLLPQFVAMSLAKKLNKKVRG